MRFQLPTGAAHETLKSQGKIGRDLKTLAGMLLAQKLH
jgi:hypothetical protein